MLTGCYIGMFFQGILHALQAQNTNKSMLMCCYCMDLVPLIDMIRASKLYSR